MTDLSAVDRAAAPDRRAGPRRRGLPQGRASPSRTSPRCSTTTRPSPRWSRRSPTPAATPTGRSSVDKVVGMEARGFILGRAGGARAGRRASCRCASPASCPGETRAVSYELEYGEETLEMHTDALAPGDRVLVVDDVLATGGTARATAAAGRAGRRDVVHGLAVMMELSFLPGSRDRRRPAADRAAHRLSPPTARRRRQVRAHLDWRRVCRSSGVPRQRTATDGRATAGGRPSPATGAARPDPTPRPTPERAPRR